MQHNLPGNYDLMFSAFLYSAKPLIEGKQQGGCRWPAVVNISPGYLLS